MTQTIQPWIQAARPAAHPMILAPLLLGQLLAWRADSHFSAWFLLWALLFGALFQIFLLYLNDRADAAIDPTNHDYWLSGGSRVIPQGKLGPDDLLAGARAALAALIVLTAALAAFGGRPWMPLGLAAAVALCWAYNLRPVQLSYRGHGEMAQGLGCGVVLPLIGFYLQRGSLHGLAWEALIPLYLIFHAGNIVTALPDYASDKAGGKRTFPVRHNPRRACLTVLLLLTLAFGGVIVANLHRSSFALTMVLLPAALMLIFALKSGILGHTQAPALASIKRFVTWTSASQAWLLGAWIVALLLESGS